MEWLKCHLKIIAKVWKHLKSAECSQILKCISWHSMQSNEKKVVTCAWLEWKLKQEIDGRHYEVVTGKLQQLHRYVKLVSILSIFPSWWSFFPIHFAQSTHFFVRYCCFSLRPHVILKFIKTWHEIRHHLESKRWQSDNASENKKEFNRKTANTIQHKIFGSEKRYISSPQFTFPFSFYIHFVVALKIRLSIAVIVAAAVASALTIVKLNVGKDHWKSLTNVQC